MSSLLKPFVPILCVGSKFDTPIYYIGMKTDEKEMVKLTEDMTCQSKAERELNRIRQEMGKLWLNANVGRMHLFNTDSDITKREDFLQFQMELHDVYKPLYFLPVDKPDAVKISEEDKQTWQKNEDIFVAAFIATRHPTWKVLYVVPKGSTSDHREVIIEKATEKRRIHFWATHDQFVHEAELDILN